MSCRASFGRMEYSTIKIDETEPLWCYSAKELQCVLNDLCRDHTLKTVYVDLRGYVESLRNDENFIDLSHLGGPIVLLFDTLAIELFIHADGMVQYRVCQLHNIKISSANDYIPENIGFIGGNHYRDLKDQFELRFEEQRVESVSVDSIDCYPFDLSDFDKEKAEAAQEINDLPSAIHLKLQNGVDFTLYGEIEYYSIKLKKQPD